MAENRGATRASNGHLTTNEDGKKKPTLPPEPAIEKKTGTDRAECQVSRLTQGERQTPADGGSGRKRERERQAVQRGRAEKSGVWISKKKDRRWRSR